MAAVRSTGRSGFAWLELLMVLAGLALVLQLFLPSVWWAMVSSLDVRNWSRLTWFLVNLGVLVALVGIRLAPDARQALAVRKAEAEKRRHRDERKQRAAQREERLSRRTGR